MNVIFYRGFEKSGKLWAPNMILTLSENSKIEVPELIVRLDLSYIKIRYHHSYLMMIFNLTLTFRVISRFPNLYPYFNLDAERAENRTSEYNLDLVGNFRVK